MLTLFFYSLTPNEYSSVIDTEVIDEYKTSFTLKFTKTIDEFFFILCTCETTGGKGYPVGPLDRFSVGGMYRDIRKLYLELSAHYCIS